jgi:DNA-binding MarR family transcriptional regulator
MLFSPKAQLDEQVFVLLSQSYMLCRKLAEKEAAMAGITLAEYSFLRLVENVPGITASEVRKRLFMTAPSVAQLVKSVSEKEMIERGSDTDDTRRQPLRLTKTGTKAVKNARASIHNALKKRKIPPTLLESLSQDLSLLFSSLSSYGG